MGIPLFWTHSDKIKFSSVKKISTSYLNWIELLKKARSNQNSQNFLFSKRMSLPSAMSKQIKKKLILWLLKKLMWRQNFTDIVTQVNLESKPQNWFYLDYCVYQVHVTRSCSSHSYVCSYIYLLVGWFVNPPGQTKYDTDLKFGTHTSIDLI